MKRRRLKPKDRVLENGRVLTQAYERLFPNPADRMFFLRKGLGLSQRALGEQCDCSSGVFSNIEKGYGLPRGVTLVKIAKGLQVSADYVLNLSTKKDIER